MKRLLTLICIVSAATLLVTGCASSGGRADAGLKATFSQADDGTATGKVSTTREFDPITGKIVKETTTLENVASYDDRDRSKVGARGLFAIQTVEKFGHERNGRTGGSSKTGMDNLKHDPDEKAIEAGGTAAGKLANEVLKK